MTMIVRRGILVDEEHHDEYELSGLHLACFPSEPEQLQRFVSTGYAYN